ncbi:hypothetical protein L911_3819 [Vibrio fluvialis I21563]|nr:hypothetical protein L911_3819 [Vibrio fluvialis I21563]
MISPKSIAHLISRSKKLRSALLNVIAADDPMEIQALPDDLIPITESLERLLALLKTNSDDESQYCELADVYLITSRLADSAILSINGRFSTAYQLTQELHQLVTKYLTHLDIIINRKKIEDSLFDINPAALEASFNDKINKLTKKFEESVKNIKKEIQTELVQFEEESINRILIAGQSAERTIESGSRRLEQVAESIDGISEHELKNIRASINEIQSLALEKLRTETSDVSNIFQTHLSNTLNSFDKHYNGKISGINKRIDDEVKAFEVKRKDIDALLEKVGIAQDADVTITQANKELISATWLRWTGLAFMCGSIALLIYFFRYYIGFAEVPQGVPLPELKDLGFEFFALRFMTVILVSSPAMYLLKESAAHRAKENLYRQRGTQLLTIRGYLADLSDEQRSEVKHRLADNFFSFHNGKADTSNVPDFIKNMNEAIKIAHAIKTPPASASEKKEQATSA